LPRRVVGTNGRGEVAGKRSRRLNMVQTCVHMYVNAKIISFETISVMRGERGERRTVEEVNSSMIYLI
jgi:hypothetical protein